MAGTIAGLWTIMGQRRRMYAAAGAALIIATGFQLAFPWILRRAIDGLASGAAWQHYLVWFSIGLLLIATGEALFTYMKGRLAARAAEGSVSELRQRLFRHLLLLPFASHGRIGTGDLVQRATTDVQTINRFLGTQVVEIMRTLCLLLGGTAAMFSLDPALAFVALGFLPPVFLFALVFFSRLKSRFQKLDEAEARLSSLVQEQVTGIRVVQAFARESYELGRFDAANSELRQRSERFSYLHAMFWPLSDSLSYLLTATVLAVGGLRVISGAISLGTFVAFDSYTILLLFPVRNLGRLIVELGRATVALRRICEVLAMEPEELGQAKGPRWTPRSGIELRNVGFAYDDLPVLRGVSFVIRPGETVAVMGTTGCGKSTLVHLLARFWDNYSGEILFDGKELRNIPRAEARRRIGLVMQEPFLFSRTLRDNIAFGARDATAKQIHNAARAAAVEQTIATFAEGYSTMVDERGMSLSGGQRQRVALARTLVCDPPVLVLDDTTSALDADTEARVWEQLRRRGRQRMSIVITHRVSTAAMADRILVLEQGRLVQQGAPHELIHQPGLFQRLHQLQNQRQAQLRKELTHAARSVRGREIRETV